MFYMVLVKIRGESMTSACVVGCDGFLDFRCYLYGSFAENA